MMVEFIFESLSIGGEVTPIWLQKKKKKNETKITRYGAKKLKFVQ